MIAQDPHTYTGAKNIGSLFPVSATDIILEKLFSKNTLIKTGEDSWKPTVQDQQEAAHTMSSLFA